MTWQERARCVGRADDIDDAMDTGPAERAAFAAALCGPCPVRAECTDLAARDQWADGLYGGQWLLRSYHSAHVRRSRWSTPAGQQARVERDHRQVRA